MPSGPAVRPTTERAREALFNILIHAVLTEDAEDNGGGLAGLAVVDAFAGSGALGLEALSRGARHATFIERDPAALAALRRNVATLGETARATVLSLDAVRLPPPPRAPGLPADLVFLDPPYGEGLAGPALAHLGGRRWLNPGCRCVVESGAKEAFAPPPGFALLDRRTYGAAQIVFLVWRPPAAPDRDRERADA